MKSNHLFFVLPLVLIVSAIGQQAAPEKALKYHEVLMKRPQNAALFDRFYGAWLDEQPIESLEAFLVSRATSNGGQDWAILARYQLRRGQEEQALESLAKAIAAVPDDVTLSLERAKIRLRRMEFGPAREDLALVAKGKDEALALEAVKLTGKSWLREGKSEEAIKTWDSLLDAHPNDEDLLEDLVESAAAEGETTQALVYVERLIKATVDPYKKTLRAMRQGDLLAKGGKNDEAAAAYATTLAQVGEGSWLESEILTQIEKVFLKEDRIQDLVSALKKLVEANPRRLLIHRQLAKLEASQGDVDAAIGRFREVLKRSPGEVSLREEFVRLLSDSERLDDAAVELEKMIELAPADAALQLQMAALRSRQNRPEAILAALQKAYELLGKDESSAIRISSLMFQYAQNEAGEDLLKQAVAVAGVGPAPAEALAAQYGRLNRKPEALELLKKVADSGEVDVVLRAANSILTLGESVAAFEILTSKQAGFSSEPRFLAAFVQMALAANKAPEGVEQAVKLVRLSKQTAEIGENINLALRVFVAADKQADLRASLEAQASRSTAETCLLAGIIEGQADFPAVTKLMETQTDTMAIHFYAALLDRRGDFDQAIVTLSRLADTDEGRKAAFFKDLSELQQRAGKTADALATVERWKQSAPGDKAAWLAGSRMLRENGKPEEAVKMTRQAVARFENDSDLAASLASLHEEAGQWADAEAIYWRLYEESENPAEQARWAGQLAMLAMQNGKTEALAEKLQERARGNRRSIGPILAQAELARITEDEDKRRDLLLEAVRLQPKDVDLRLQIANLEEQSGNLERVIALLEDAAPQDPSGRLRAALAQAYLRQGQTVRGMREMQAMSGKNLNDPRAIETNAATLAGAGLYDEAIRFLRESLPDGGDWRCQYLLAIMLEKDGREAEAIPIFLDLQKAQGALAGVKPNPNGPLRYLEHYAEEVRPLMLISWSISMAYVHEGENARRFGGLKLTGPFALPDDAEEARRLALVHLLKLARKSPDGGTLIQSRLKAAGLTNGAFFADLVESSNQNQPNYIKLLESHPAEPGLLEIVLLYSGYRGNPQAAELTPALVKTAVAASKDLAPLTRFRAALFLTTDAKADDPAWAQLSEATGKLTEAMDTEIASQLGYQIMTLLSDKKTSLPEAQREDLKKTLLNLTKVSPDAENMDSFRLAAVSVVGSKEEWIDALNASITRLRQKPIGEAGLSSQLQGMRAYSRQNVGYNLWTRGGDGNNLFSLPTIDSLCFQSLPANLVRQLRPLDERQNYGGGFPLTDPQEIITHLARIESPTLRLWIAIRAKNADAIASALSATPPKDEMADFEMLRAFQAIQEKKFGDAWQALEKVRASQSTNPIYSTWLNITLIAVASEMKPEERTEISQTLRTILVQCRQQIGITAADMVAAKATQFGFEDLAIRFHSPTLAKTRGGSVLRPAGFGKTNSSSSRSSSGSGSMDRLIKLSSENKHAAAAREALLLFRKAKSNQWNSGYELRELLSKLGEETRAELLKTVAPGDSKSLTKRLEYADVCILLEKNESALTTLEGILVERPNDTSIVGKMAFVLPPQESERRNTLMTTAASSDDFAALVYNKVQQLSQQENNKDTIDFFERIASWLEVAPPEKLENANLTWVGYSARQFFSRGNTENLPDLLSLSTEKIEDQATADQRAAIAKRLALAMLRYPSLSEEGFRLYSGAKAWTVPEAELDAKAREVLAAATIDEVKQNKPTEFFSISFGNGNGSGGSGDGELAAYASVRWLAQRLAKAKSADEILPPDYLKTLTEKNPVIGELVSALAGISNVDQLAKLWESESLKTGNDRFISMLRQGVLARAGSVPGASKFFLGHIAEIDPEKVDTRISDGVKSEERTLFAAALSSGVRGKPEELDAVCRAISKIVFGEVIKIPEQDSNYEFYYKLNFISTLINGLTVDDAGLLKLHSSLFRLGIPASRQDYDVVRPFQNRQFAKPEDAEAFFESLGMLADLPDWRPFAAIIVDSEHSGQTISYQRKPTLLNERLCSSINTSFSRSDLIKRLRDRKPATFGALITAASMSSGKERFDLTAQAFSAASKALAKLPADQIEGLALVLPWLPEEAIVKLPPSFREKAKLIAEDRRKELVKKADGFLAGSPNSNRNSNNPFDEIRPFLGELVRHDFEKAVQVFLSAEQRFTTSLTRGARLSSSSSQGFEISERDEAISRLWNSSDSVFYQNPLLSLKFISAVMKSPQGGRFTLASGYSNTLHQRLGEMFLQQARKKGEVEKDRWIANLKAALAVPEEFRKDALIAVSCAHLGQWSYGNLNNVNNGRKMIASARDEQIKKSGPQNPLVEAYTLQEMVVGINGWNLDSAEEKEKTAKALSGLLEDSTIPESLRMQFSFGTIARAPAILSNPAVAASAATLYERYCAEERSAVNPLSIAMIKAIAAASVTDENKAYLIRINDAFWKNANSPKITGHPPIPPGYVSSLFVAAIRLGNDEIANKLKSQAKLTLSGHLNTIALLIAGGQYATAVSFLSEPGKIYRGMNNLPAYDKNFEENLAAFSKEVEPLQFMRLECQLLQTKTAEGQSAPRENGPARSMRLAAAYKKDPPKERLIQLEMLTAITERNPLAVLELRDEFTRYAEATDFETAFRDWAETVGTVKDYNPRFMLGQMDARIYRQAAMVNLLRGDGKLLEVIKQVVLKAPPSVRSSRGERSNALGNFTSEISNTACFWFAIGIANGDAAGFESALPTFEELALLCDAHSYFSAEQTQTALALCQFIAYWTGQPDRFKDLSARMKSRKKEVLVVSKPQGLTSVFQAASRMSGWKAEELLESRKKFQSAIFSRPSLAALFPSNNGWSQQMSNASGNEDFLNLAVELPADFIPEVRAQLYDQRGDMLMEKKPEEAAGAYRSALQACRAGAEHNFLRGMIKIHLTDALFQSKQMDEAKTVYATISPEEVSEDRKEKYVALGKQLSSPQKDKD